MWQPKSSLKRMNQMETVFVLYSYSHIYAVPNEGWKMAAMLHNETSGKPFVKWLWDWSWNTCQKSGFTGAFTRYSGANCKRHKMYNIYFSWKYLVVYTPATQGSGTNICWTEEQNMQQNVKVVSLSPIHTYIHAKHSSCISSCLVTKRKWGTWDSNQEWQRQSQSSIWY